MRPAGEAGLTLPAGEAGLTLIEMLVVLAIVGVASGAAVLSLSPSRGVGVEVEAGRLAAAIQASADATMVGALPAALLADAAGYRVAQRVDGKWRGARHDLLDDVRLEGAGAAGVPLALGDGGAIDLTLVRGAEAWTVRFDGLHATVARRDTSAR